MQKGEDDEQINNDWHFRVKVGIINCAFLIGCFTCILEMLTSAYIQVTKYYLGFIFWLRWEQHSIDIHLNFVKNRGRDFRFQVPVECWIPVLTWCASNIECILQETGFPLGRICFSVTLTLLKVYILHIASRLFRCMSYICRHFRWVFSRRKCRWGAFDIVAITVAPSH